ncbi:hypothetical protein BBI17_009265 [Phytophthora kernoviae]|uniref:Uncharacterized protein n=1 Tax=Phytophthora kernoviae TaxID=325452 RepID=A0A3R7J9K7_9STRA|nr:hypothetical protein BBI17_009265 [Phytophthora kernoviae]
MNLRMIIFVAAAALFVAIDAISIDHDKVQPFPQPEPVTDSEKAAVKFKPRLKIINGCGVYSAVNAAGETNGGLKGTGGVSGCDDYGKIAPVSNPNTIDGTAPKFLIDYPEFGWSNTYLYSALEDGDFQDLIMWEQLTDAARAALETTDFGDIDAPFTDANFNIHLTSARPSGVKK